MFNGIIAAFRSTSWNRAAHVLTNHKFILSVWILAALIISIKQFVLGSYNNYNIFTSTYFHAVKGLNLYDLYPKEHLDSNHYGPLFSLVIAPIALLPDLAGMILWQILNILFLFYAIKQLPIEFQKVNIVYWIILNELITAMLSFQFNISITAIIIITYSLIEKRKNFWAAFFILFGTFIKLYGIVGLAFFFFVHGKVRFVLYCIFWTCIFFTLPMLFFTPDFVIQSYSDWYSSLVQKQALNASLTSMQDVSLMGIVRRVSGNASIPNLPFLIVGLIVFALPYLRIKQYKSKIFRLYYLTSVLIFTVIFSNSSESPTYIIAFAGVAIWFVIQSEPVNPIFIFLFIFAMVVTSFSPTDIFPRFIRNEFIRPYSLKALPCVMIWLTICYQLFTTKFNVNKLTNE